MKKICFLFVSAFMMFFECIFSTELLCTENLENSNTEIIEQQGQVKHSVKIKVRSPIKFITDFSKIYSNQHYTSDLIRINEFNLLELSSLASSFNPSDEISIRIYDISGRLLKSERKNHNSVIDISSIEGKILFAKLEYKDVIKSLILIK